ncbi:endonuclease/exonuclease/phosphatase family protein [Micromonospora sp. NPDC049799]|uniref:endonuclease/exonuclease/phosphatase family protein n=1 Tax=Micromonospora sp. NPDC049799 TaxID=3154741 RepID=UPI003410EB61
MESRYRGLRRVVAVLLLTVAVAVPAGSTTADTAGSTSLRVLQMNLCNSGRAGCYTGRSVAGAVEVIRAEEPDVVSLNEICRDDVQPLRRALADVRVGGTVVSAFQAAGDRPSGDATRCRNGQPYGIGLLVFTPRRGHVVHAGIHPTQDLADPEERAWLCVSATVVHACTTHLAAFSTAAALGQCRHLFDTVLPAVRSTDPSRPLVLGGDLNLRQGGTPDVRSCVPPDHPRADDGAVQQITATTDLTVQSTRSIDMGGTTDHPSMLVTLTSAL